MTAPHIIAEEIELKVQAALYLGPIVTMFDQEYRNKEKFLLLKSDIETDDLMIAVSLSASGLDVTMNKYTWINENVHKSQKNIILLAPNYTDLESIKYIENNLGIKIIKDITQIS